MNNAKPSITVLVVEDDRRLAQLVAEYLVANDFNVVIENNGAGALAFLRRQRPDVVVLDLMLPGLNGLDVCRAARKTYTGPILILTAKEDDVEQVLGLELGADDFVKKPVAPRVLLARIRALLRRVHGESAAMVGPAEDERTFGALRIKHSARQVQLAGVEIALTTSEFDLLWLLAAQPGVVQSRTALFRELRGIDHDGLDRSIDITISRLRKKLGDTAVPPAKIKAVRARGYLFVADGW